MNKKKIAQDFRRFAASYEHRATLQKEVAEELIALSKPYLGAGLMLDIGCGSGFIAKNIDKAVISTDIVYEMCAQCKPAVVADFENLPFKKNSFGAIFSASSLQWHSDFAKAISDINLLLKKDGVFALAVFTNNSLQELKNIIDISRFQPLPAVKEMEEILANNFKTLQKKIAHRKEPYADYKTLLDSIRKIGASNKNFTKPLAKSDVRKLKGEKEVFAIWEVFYFVGKKL